MSSLARRIAQGKLRLLRGRLKGRDTRPPSPGNRPKVSRSIASLNRHTGKPHAHLREIARHVRQARGLPK